MAHQDLGEMERSYARPTLAQSTFNMHQAADIAAHHSLNICLLDLIQLNPQDRRRNGRMIDGEHAPETTTIRVQTMDGWSGLVGQKFNGLLVHTQISQ